MSLEVGIDIEKISRFKKKPVTFLKSIFSDKEIDYCKNKSDPSASFTGKFCAKEAVIKAYNKKITARNIEILNDESGKIKVYIDGKWQNNITCSISHTNDTAIAIAMIY